MIAGYIGKESAALVLCEMQKRQESIFGGFYSGIATCKNGRLYRERVLGNIDILNDTVAEGCLPGTIGIAHSRSNSGGGISWAQPRLNLGKRIATAGNGFLGVLANQSRTSELAEKLIGTGLQFQTATDAPIINAAPLSNGSYVHAAEVSLEAISLEFAKAGSFEQAVRATDMRSESVEIYLTAESTQTLYIVNYNQRLIAAKTEIGMQIATSRLAFGRSIIWELEIPANSFARVNENEVLVKPLWLIEDRYDFNSPENLSQVFLSYIAANPGSFWEDVVDNALYPQFAKGSASLAAIVGHRLFEKCLANSEIFCKLDQVVGLEGQIAPKFRLYIGRA